MPLDHPVFSQFHQYHSNIEARFGPQIQNLNIWLHQPHVACLQDCAEIFNFVARRHSDTSNRYGNREFFAWHEIRERAGRDCWWWALSLRGSVQMQVYWNPSGLLHLARIRKFLIKIYLWFDIRSAMVSTIAPMEKMKRIVKASLNVAVQNSKLRLELQDSYSPKITLRAGQVKQSTQYSSLNFDFKAKENVPTKSILLMASQSPLISKSSSQTPLISLKSLPALAAQNVKLASIQAISRICSIPRKLQYL